MKLSNLDVGGMYVNIKMALELAVSFCGKSVLVVNDDDGGKDCSKDFVCLNKVPKSCKVHVQLVG